MQRLYFGGPILTMEPQETVGRAQESAAQRDMEQGEETQGNAAQRDMAQGGETQENAVRKNAAQRDMTQGGETQGNAARKNAAQRDRTENCGMLRWEQKAENVQVRTEAIVTDQANGAEAVVTENGRILAVGSRENLLEAYPEAEPWDLKGSTLMPSFIDAHSHFSSVANGMLQVSLEHAESLEEIRDRIRSFIRENRIPAGQWVTAQGYDHNELPGGAHPALDFADACAPEHPLVMKHASGHSGVVNSLALKELGITEETEAPAGGVIGRENGHLTGYLEENAFIENLRKIPMADPEKLLEAYGRAQKLYASFGITTIQEGMAARELLYFYRELLERNLLILDVVGFPDAAAIGEYETAFPESIKKYDRNFKIGGIKTFLDGSPQGRTAWMRTPYQGEESYCGYGTMTEEALDQVIHAAEKRQMQLLAHCNGDAAAEQYIRRLLKAERTRPETRKLRPVMIHAQLLGRDQLEAVKQAGILPSFFVAHVYHWGEIHRKNFGEERAAAISPAASALEQNIRFTFHQDAPVIPPDMLETVWCAVNRETKSGQVLGAGERISVYEALKAVTINAAYQYFEEDTKGSIRPGKYEDFVILDQNPLTVEPEKLREIQVMATIRRGKVIYRR